ncbi:MAG: endonuclease NucS domain-containing protein [Terriglobia bacterium]
MEVPQSKQREPSLIPKYLVQLLSKILAEENRPIGIADLLGMALAVRGEIPVEFVEKRLYVLATREDSPFFVAEYPGFKLRSVSKLPDFSKVSEGLRYVTDASKVLISSKEYIDVREIVSKIQEKKLYKFPTKTPEYWMYFHLSNQKKFFLQKGTLTIGLKEWQHGKVVLESASSGRPLIQNKPELNATDDTQVTHNIHEANLESVVIQQLDKIEEGLQLMERQRVCPGIGRIDVLCKDRHGDLVIVELKSFWAKQDSIVDQIGRYMGYVRSYLAKPGQNVRGIILVAKADEKLRHAVAGFPNLDLREFDLTIK